MESPFATNRCRATRDQVLIDHKVQSSSLHKELDSLARDRDQVKSELHGIATSCSFVATIPDERGVKDHSKTSLGQP